MASGPLIPANWQLPSELRRRLGLSVGRQRVMEHEGHLIIVAHEVPSAREDRRQGVLFWRDPNGQWQASNGEPAAAAIELLLDRYEKRIDQFDQAEVTAKGADQYLPLLEGLAPVTRSIRNLHAVLGEARKALPDEIELINHRDRAYDLSRTAELSYQFAKDSMDVAVVRKAEEQAIASGKMEVAAHRLNIMAALFFPLATLAGIFGTTLTEGWSWAESPLPFYLFLGIGLLAGVMLASMIGKRG